MVEMPAKGVRGFILNTGKEWVFRVHNPLNRLEFKDYRLCCDDLEVEVTSSWASLFDSENPQKRKLDWSMDTRPLLADVVGK